MRQLAAATVVLLFVAAGASASETQRYLVGTKQPFRAGTLAAIVREARTELQLRGAEGFGAAFDGFAADLTSDEVAELKRNPNVRWVEPVMERHAFAQVARNPQLQTVPYGVDLIRAREVWPTKHTSTINVVVIDTGVDYRHPELQRVWAGGYNFIAKTEDPLDDRGHGTHVAGTIAAAHNNHTGVVGVSPDIRLWGLKVLNSAGSGKNEDIVRAIDWAIAKKEALGGNWILNLSLGSANFSFAENEACLRGISKGLLIVAATGNDSTATVTAPISFPAGYEGVVAVGAIDEALAIATFSNQGPQLDLVAPGVDVLSTLPLGSGSLASVTTDSIRYNGIALTGSKLGTVTAPYVYCGLGKPDEIPASVSGKIALIKRGELRFAEKTRNAMAAGAIAVAIFNHDASPLNFTLIIDEDPTTATTDWPVTVALSKADGEALVERNGGTITVANVADDYGFASGTSMASPHVAGAAALLWSTAPDATATDVASALRATAKDLGASGVDNTFGAGLVNVYDAVMRLAPAAFPPAPTPPTSGRRILKRD